MLSVAYHPRLAAHVAGIRQGLRALGGLELVHEWQGPLSPDVPAHLQGAHDHEAIHRRAERAQLPPCGRVVLLSGDSRSRTAVQVAAGVYLSCETPGQAAALTAHLARAGYHAQGVAPEDVAGRRLPRAELLVQALPPTLRPELAALQQLERVVRRRARARTSLPAAIAAVGEAESAEEGRDLAACVVQAHNLTVAGVQGLLTHPTRAVRLAAVVALPRLQQAVASQTTTAATDWRGPLMASLRGTPTALLDELQALPLGQGRTLPEAVQQVAGIGRNAVVARRRHLLDTVREVLASGTAPTPEAGLAEAAARCSALVPPQLTPAQLYAQLGPARLVMWLHESGGAREGYVERLLGATDAVMAEAVAQGGGLTLGPALATVLQRAYQRVPARTSAACSRCSPSWPTGSCTGAAPAPRPRP